MSSDLTISVEHRGPLQLMRLRGAFVRPDAPQLISALGQGLRSGHRVVVCDLGRLAPVGSVSLLAAFPAALRACGSWPLAALHLAGAGEQLGRQLRRSALHRYLPVYADVEDACRSAASEIGAQPVELELDPDPECLQVVRSAVRGMSSAWTDSDRQDALVIANELASNAIRHVAEPFLVSLAVAPSGALVAVRDCSRRAPALRSRPSDGSGRGLQIVSALSRRWGFRLVYGAGKTVWAGLPGPAARIPRNRTASA